MIFLSLQMKNLNGKEDLIIDRDLNAAKSLEQLLHTASSAEIKVCGQDGSVIMLKTLSQPAWKKQELSRV